MAAQLFLRLLLALSWLLAASLAAAQSPSPEPPVLQLSPEAGNISLEGQSQYWIEPGKSRTIDEIAAAGNALPWVTLAPGQQHRLGKRALWIRFRAESRDAERWYLAVGSSGIDRAQFYFQGADGQWVVEEAGDTRPVSEWPLPGRVPTFDLSPGQGPATTYWLRIEHDRVDYAAPLTLFSQSRMFGERESEQFMLGAYFGLASLLAVVAMFNAVGYRDRNFIAYAVYLITFTMGQAAYLGLGAQYIWEDWLAWNAQSTFLLPALSAPAALWFVQVVTEPARFSRALNQLVLALIVMLLLAAVLDTVMSSRLTIVFRLALTSTALLLVGVLIGLVWLKGDDPDIRIIALGFVPVLVMAMFPIARGFALLPNSILTRYGLAIGAAMEMPILFYALSLRGNRRRFAQLRASALPYTDALTGLANRRNLLQRLDAALHRARNQKHPCALLVAKVANYDAIAAEYGRDMLDRALVVTASHLRRAASDIDLAARVSEREFALLIEGPTTPDVVSSRAQQVVASGLRSSRALAPELTLRLVVVIALLPDERPDASSTLDWVLEALGAIRPDSRKQIRALNI
ncbi:MAG TPA: 7TM diverse intracellular signaling domain-containing protein [Ramlibacter sp.]|uniref:sensor domain-containing diguanylate cyclase n=1 Tax=Ramlibacter sp. TaxID=1917967 RepID=UPI002D6EF0F4|nr:7TM diverse intracellular signaling domain-containing protein [Ramlibacter sp.]HZY19904.1 7TM diverse intracellular signaling domain-containing protein [Ramlibacter sp.]